MREEAGHIVETPVEVRAGFLDRPALVVLVLSTSLMIGAFAVLCIGFLRGKPPKQNFPRPQPRRIQGLHGPAFSARPGIAGT